MDSIKEPGRLTYTVEEAGEMLGISRAKAYESARTGELPTVRFGRRMVVPVDGLLRLLGVSEDDRRELVRSCLVQPRDDVAVGVEGDRDVRVAEPLRDDLGVDASAERERRRRVSQVVQPDLRQLGSTDRVAERLADVLRLEGSTIDLREHQIEGRVDRFLKGR